MIEVLPHQLDGIERDAAPGLHARSTVREDHTASLDIDADEPKRVSAPEKSLAEIVAETEDRSIVRLLRVHFC